MNQTAVLADEVDYDEVPDRLLHKKGCPKNRVEVYKATPPGMNVEGVDRRTLTVSRCLDCGNQHEKENR